MSPKSLIAASLALLAAFFASTQLARADDAPLKVAICNPVKVINQIKEYQDIQQKITQDQTDLRAQAKDRSDKIAAMQEELKLLLPNTADYDKKNTELITAEIDAKVWLQVHDLDESRKVKESIKSLFAKVDAAVAQVAKDKGIGLVLSDQHLELPTRQEDLDKMDANTVQGILAQRTILFNEPKLDITPDVVLALDKAYMAGH